MSDVMVRNSPLRRDPSFVIDNSFADSSWCLPLLAQTTAAEMGGQDPRADLGPAMASHGQHRPTSSEDSQSLRQHDEGTSRHETAVAPLYPNFFDDSGCFLDLDFHNSDLTLPIRTYALNEDGGGSMVVAPSDEQRNNVILQHDTPIDGLLPPATDERIPDMAATVDASALPTLPAPGSESAPANHDVMDRNGLPLLDAPIDFAHSGDLRGASMNDMPMSMSMPMDMASGFAMDAFPMPQSNERLTAFARLRFDDGSYYMHTYSIVLGRNLELARRDTRRLELAEKLEAKGRPRAAQAALRGEEDDVVKKKKKKHGRRGARSVISEKGGIVTAPIASMPIEYQQRRQSNASHSLSSNSHPTGESAEEKPAERAPQDMIMQAFPEVPAQFDGHVPENPNDCPFVPIHPNQIIASSGSLGPKGISREHAMIYYNFDEGHFAVRVLGNNGLHHEGEFYPPHSTVVLDHGDHLLIGAVNVHFYLPDVSLTEDQRHRHDSGSRPMSFSFENGNGQLESDEHISSEDEDQQSVNPRHVYYHYPVSDSDDDDALCDDEMDDYEEPAPKPRQKTSLKLKIKNLGPAPTAKESKKAHKRKHHHREFTPEELPAKKIKIKVKEPTKAKEPVREHPKETKVHKERKEAKEPKEPKESKEKEISLPKETKERKEAKEPKEPKEPKEKGKAPAKAPAKTTIKAETPVEELAKDPPPVAKPEQPSKPPPNDSPPLLRKPHEGELEAGGEIDGLITEEMAIQHNLPRNLIGHVVEKRKGPGRPPKDGIMSKRQRSQLIKQAKDIERARAAGIDPADIPMPSIKPKPPKRKESNAGEGEDDGLVETTELGDGTLSGLQKQVKPMRPPRTPSPEQRIEDYTEEDLQRPTANYVVLIHEAISSSTTGQMNLQSIYTFIERKYPWYKFKTTTSGWQSSVRHNLGQHDAFMKGDKEGKGYLWRINPEVSIEKERRKRQVSPTLNHAPRPQYYPPPNGYQPYPQPGYPYHQGMPHGMPQAPPRLPPSLAQPRLPPSMARNESNAAAPTAPQGAPPPYASPWGGGGNSAGSPPAPNPPRPYPQPSSQTPPVSSAAGPSGQYGVLYPTAAPQQQSYNGPSAASPYGGPYANAGASPYGPRPYPTYPPPGQNSSGQSSASPYGPPPPAQGPPHQGPPNDYPIRIPHPSGRYSLDVHTSLIGQLETFRDTYLNNLPGPAEEKKVDNAIRACVDSTVPESTLTAHEHELLRIICGLPGVARLIKRTPPVKREDTHVVVQATAASTAAAMAADAAANTSSAQQQPSPPQPSAQPAQQYPPPSIPQNQRSPPSAQRYPPQTAPRPSTSTASPAPVRESSEPHKFTPNMTGESPPALSNAAPAHPPQLSHRPSVEPITPVPGSPAVQNGTPFPRRPVNETNADNASGTEDVKKVDSEDDAKPPVPKTE